MNQYMLEIFQGASTNILFTLQLLCVAMLPSNFLCSLLTVWLLARYQRKTVIYSRQIIELFTTIEPSQLTSYEEYYRNLKSNVPMQGYERGLPQSSKHSVRKCVFAHPKERNCSWYHMLLFLLLVICEIMCCGKTLLLIPTISQDLNDMNALLQSENLQISAQVEINELIIGVDKMGSTRFRRAVDKINMPQIAFPMAAQRLLGSRLHSNTVNFESVLTSNICELAK